MIKCCKKICNESLLVLECPEQVHDNKTLYERLQEQKQKKQDEWDEQHQLSKFFMFYIILQNIFQCRFDAGILFCNDMNVNLLISVFFYVFGCF